MLTEIHDIPDEVLERILLEAAVASATDRDDVDYDDVLDSLSRVCRLWDRLVQSDWFRDRFVDTLLATGS